METEAEVIEELRAKAQHIADFLTERKGMDTAVVDVTGRCNWADFFVITTVNSVGHLRGLVHDLWEEIDALELTVRNRHKAPGIDGWELIDCGQIIIHLMSAELRGFYSLEKLWSGPVPADAEIIPDAPDGTDPE